MRRLWFALVVSCVVAGCGKFEPAGTFVGDVTEQYELLVHVGAIAPDGTGTVNSSSNVGGSAGASLVVTEEGDGLHARVAYCDVALTALSADHVAEIAEGQTCEADAEGRTFVVPVMGQLSYTDDGVHFNVHGEYREDTADVPEGLVLTWSLIFDGAAEE